MRAVLLRVCVVAIVLPVVVAGCRRHSPDWPEESLDPLVGTQTLNKPLISSDGELLRELYDGCSPLALTRESAAQLASLLWQVNERSPRLLVAKSVSAADLTETDLAVLRQWVKDGGVLWLRADSSLESYFGVQWKARKKHGQLSRRLLRDDGEILPHYLTRGVRRVVLLGLGVYEPVTPLAKRAWQTVLLNETGCAFAVLPYGAGKLIFDSCGIDPQDRDPFYGISGFDADVFWANFVSYVGILGEETGLKLKEARNVRERPHVEEPGPVTVGPAPPAPPAQPAAGVATEGMPPGATGGVSRPTGGAAGPAAPAAVEQPANGAMREPRTEPTPPKP